MTHNRNVIGTLDARGNPPVETPVTSTLEEARRLEDSLPGNEELLHLGRLATLGELSSCFAHEVFNPLMLIRGHLRFVDEELAPDHPLRINFEVIERAARRIEEMARRMLDFSRKRVSKPEPFDAAELISDALKFMQPFFQEQYTEIRLNIARGLPRIDVDRWQIVQALVNLFQNAAHAMAARDSRCLSVGVTQAQENVRIVITDNGGGIDEEDLPRIFTPFFTTKGERGTGLGLYITKKIIEEHGGQITVQSSSRGTTFVVSLPLHH